MAKVKSISARDFKGAAGVGALGEIVTITLSLDEAVTATNATVNLNTVVPTFKVNDRTLEASLMDFVSFNGKDIVYAVRLPDGIANANSITLSNLSLNNITLKGDHPGALRHPSVEGNNPVTFVTQASHPGVDYHRR